MRRWIWAFAAVLFATAAGAAEVKVAVAANFADPAKDIAALFKKATGDDAALSFGASGPFYEQIKQGAPFEVFLSADQKRPKMAETDGFAVPSSVFTYAVGKLVLYSPSLDLADGEKVLREGKFEKLSVADPAAAPYGEAAIQTLKALKLYDQLQPKIVQGATIGQAYQFVSSGNAQLGFVALSQIAKVTTGSRWSPPQEDYAPIRQDAALLKPGADDPAAKAFLAFLKSPEAKAVIAKYGYETP